MLVQSKYKNPDKFIAKLKRRNTFLRRARNGISNNMTAACGSVVLTWGKGTSATQDCGNMRALGDFKLGDRVVIVGEVTGAQELLVGGKPQSNITYRLLRTRRTESPLL